MRRKLEGKMHKCGCGMPISFYEEYCNQCRENLTLREKVIEGIRRDKISGMSSSSNLNNTKGGEE